MAARLQLAPRVHEEELDPPPQLVHLVWGPAPKAFLGAVDPVPAMLSSFSAIAGMSSASGTRVGDGAVGGENNGCAGDAVHLIIVALLNIRKPALHITIEAGVSVR